MQIAKKTEAPAPYMVQKEQKKQRKAAKKSSKTTDNAQEVVKTPMPIEHDVMQLKNKVSSKIWQLATQRANSETDYAAIKAAIDKLLR